MPRPKISQKEKELKSQINRLNNVVLELISDKDEIANASTSARVQFQETINNLKSEHEATLKTIIVETDSKIESLQKQLVLKTAEIGELKSIKDDYNMLKLLIRSNPKLSYILKHPELNIV